MSPFCFLNFQEATSEGIEANSLAKDSLANTDPISSLQVLKIAQATAKSNAAATEAMAEGEVSYSKFRS